MGKAMGKRGGHCSVKKIGRGKNRVEIGWKIGWKSGWLVVGGGW